jgi:cytochrome c peroxidase
MRGIGVGAILVLAGVAAACSSSDDVPAGQAGVDAGTPDAGADTNGDPVGALCTSPLPATTALGGPSHGSAVALSSDDKIAVVVNRDSGTISVFAIDYPADKAPTVTRKAEVAVGGEPWQVALHPNDDTAFVVLKRDQKLVRIDGLRTTPTKCAEVAIGSEPTSVALTPTGATVWVTSFMDGTLQGIDSTSMQVKSTVDLNAALVGSGLLGGAVQARPALAHPRAMVITNNGDTVEKDESILVTEFYAQTIAPMKADGSNANSTRAGVVYKVPLSTLTPSTIQLPPLEKMGFVDALGNDTGCFPNQVAGIHVQGAFAYATSTCASPKGPIAPFPLFNPACSGDTDCPSGGAGTCVKSGGAPKGTCSTNCTVDTDCGANGKCQANNVCIPNFNNFRTIVTPAVSVIDVGGGKVLASASLNKQFMDRYDALGYPDDSSRRLPLSVFDVGFVPGTLTAYMAAAGADGLFKVNYNATYKEKAIDSVGNGNHPYVDLTPGAVLESQMGRMPIGVAVTGAPHPASGEQYFAFVASDISRTLVTVDLSRQEIAGLNSGKPVVTESAAQPTDPKEQDKHLGKRFYYNGLGRWSLNGQGWGSCHSCHTDGGSDSVAWFAPRGAMQTQNFDGLFSSKNPDDQRVHCWSGTLDEVTDHEIAGIRGAIGGVGALVKDGNVAWASDLPLVEIGQADLYGSSMAQLKKSAVDDWQKIIAFLQGLRSPRRPSTLDAAKVKAGRDLFLQANCNGCHGGDKWTISQVFYKPAEDQSTNDALRKLSWANDAKTSGIPASVLPTTDPAMQVMRSDISDPMAAAAFDQLTCVIRNVGTFGVAEPGVGVAELRFDMTSPAQGSAATNPVTGTAGYNPPSLLSANVGAPYFHSGQARTLEAAFSDIFKGHHQALSPTFLQADDPQRAQKLEALIQFLLAIDGDMETAAIPPLGPQGGVLCKTP